MISDLDLLRVLSINPTLTFDEARRFVASRRETDRAATPPIACTAEPRPASARPLSVGYLAHRMGRSG